MMENPFQTLFVCSPRGRCRRLFAVNLFRTAIIIHIVFNVIIFRNIRRWNWRGVKTQFEFNFSKFSPQIWREIQPTPKKSSVFLPFKNS